MSENTGHDAQTAVSSSGEPADPWWKSLGYGVGLWALTVGFYFYISAFEAGDVVSARIWWPVALIYNLAGKWPIVGIGALGGLVLVGVGARDFRSR